MHFHSHARLSGGDKSNMLCSNQKQSIHLSELHTQSMQMRGKRRLGGIEWNAWLRMCDGAFTPEVDEA